MRRASFLGAALLGVLLLGLSFLPAQAFKKVDLPGTRSKEYIKDLCSGPGQRYVEGQGQYGCISDCGQGRESDACGINCSEKTNKCYGWSPGTQKQARRPIDFLRPPAGGKLKTRAP
jgi:hypothetical protein